jgi:hypothetical protein
MDSIGVKLAIKAEIANLKKDQKLSSFPRSLDERIYSLEDALKELEKSPWTLCSDRLPVKSGEDSGDWVLGQTSCGMITVVRKAWKQGHAPDYWESQCDEDYTMADIVKWMPLPKDN